MSLSVKQLDSVTIRFAGDSGDGMQLTGTQFTNASAIAGNDVATLPDFPAEIRAPAGTIAGVSGFQLHFASMEIHTPGDELDALVAMNPAALITNVGDLKPNGVLLLNTAGFTKKNLERAGYETDPREDGSLDHVQSVEVDLQKLTLLCLKDMGLPTATVNRSKNMFALGLMCWLYGRPTQPTEEWVNQKFAKKPELVEANLRVLRAGYNYGETTDAFASRFEVEPAELVPGAYRSVTGNQALAYGAVAASLKSQRPLFLGSYPITPASDVLHDLSKFKNFGVITFQAEDEIAAVCAAIGAAFGGSLALTNTSGPGMALKAEALGLAMKTELPMVVINVQRGGPSTGLPTKPEQADLFQALYGRNGESPLPVLAASTPSDCFDTMLEACRIALGHMIPVIVLSDGFLANGAEPWKYPEISKIPPIQTKLTDVAEGFGPYKRDSETLTRPWAIPGTPDMEHRIGGLEGDIETGNVSYDPDNHSAMVHLRQKRVDLIRRDIPPLTVDGARQGDLLILGWGSTRGAITTAVQHVRAEGHPVSHVHLRHLNPLPADLGELMAAFKCVLVPEMNLGQLAFLLQATYPIRVRSLTKVEGRPFKKMEIVNAIFQELGADR